MTKEPNNLKNIIQGYKWGWCAQFESEGEKMTIVSINENKKIFGVRKPNGEVMEWSCDPEYVLVDWEKDKIISWLYGGQLAGSDKIPDGTIFRVKEINWNQELIGKLVEYRGYGGAGSRLNGNYGGKEYQFDKSEIEPYFD